MKERHTIFKNEFFWLFFGLMISLALWVGLGQGKAIPFGPAISITGEFLPTVLSMFSIACGMYFFRKRNVALSILFILLIILNIALIVLVGVGSFEYVNDPFFRGDIIGL